MTGRQAANVDVTAFLSLMVILVPFLLITAVFSRITILELQAASGDGAQATARDPLQLQVVVRDAVIELYHEGQDKGVRLARTPDGSAEVAALATLINELKTRFPNSDEATILLEPQVSYEVLVQVMDAVRIRPFGHELDVADRELFPRISLGEAPPAARSFRSSP